MTASVLEAARRYHRAGLSFLPIATNGTKAPAAALLPTMPCPSCQGAKCDDCHQTGRKSTWEPFQHQQPTEQDASRWGRANVGIAMIGGAVSGNLEILDLDQAGLDTKYEQVADDHDLLDLVKRCPKVRTPSGGCHYYYRCVDPIPGNLKLARKPDKTTKIETRGEGGYAIAPPSPGSCHPSGVPYVLEHGDFAALPVLSAVERKALLDFARHLNEYTDQPDMQAPVSKTARPRALASGLRPGDDFNERGDVAALLIRHGWKLTGRHGGEIHFARPGKAKGTSATYKDGVFFIFSSNAAPFDSDRGYSHFSVYSILEHKGDFAAAASALYREGFGDRVEAASQSLPEVREVAAIEDEIDAENDALESAESISESPPECPAGGTFGNPAGGTFEAPAELPSMDFETWKRKGKAIHRWKQEFDDKYRWHVGDWWNLIPIDHGQKMKFGHDLFGQTFKTIRNYAVVAKAWPQAERGSNPFWVHAELAAQDTETRKIFLQRQADEKLNRQSLRELLKIEVSTVEKHGWHYLMKNIPREVATEIETTMRQVDEPVLVVRAIRAALRVVRGEESKKTESQFGGEMANDQNLVELARYNVARGGRESESHAMAAEAAEESQRPHFIDPDDFPEESPTNSGDSYGVTSPESVAVVYDSAPDLQEFSELIAAARADQLPAASISLYPHLTVTNPNLAVLHAVADVGKRAGALAELRTLAAWRVADLFHRMGRNENPCGERLVPSDRRQP